MTRLYLSGLVIEICSYLLECWECRGSDLVVFVRFCNRDLFISSGVLAYISAVTMFICQVW